MKNALKYIKIFIVVAAVSATMSYLTIYLWQTGGDFIIGNLGRGFAGSFLFGLWMMIVVVLTLGISFYICFSDKVIG